ncbi:tripartite tricarboxylate transporter permease [Hoeflea prorocentri]|uniref:Tripartite tricarboxylate transporter permease n=1 Tax=Hoeflea prorocentri TaxID=1922333 RepID=A0A9X3UET9_9HYPH|nr:tripartite tricarboxylate transporter permease [Hoeflea prorocentri]MCY6379405.1 tripartite tricarboxylate transporter permease [Hoeflea prorocentri]MDA5397206.1 tripartite tricarboxylate transporter permease [Hoeflea prorocentri]
MLANLQGAVDVFFQLQNFLAIAAGVLIGLFIGAIPGLSAVMGVALVLPFTFHMDPVTSILLLVGIYKGGVLGGSISAILIRTPGTPAAACTTLDGYPMTQNGQATRALMGALYASCTADLVSNICLILFAGVLASIALKFGPPEFLWLIAFSLTIVIAISSGSQVKGMISALIGVIFSLVGLDLVYGTERLTFGNLNLMSGISFIPMLVGLFALPEILEFYHKRAQEHSARALDRSKFTLEDYRKCAPSIFRGSFIGVIVGAIPGAGATAAAFLSYGLAKRFSPNGDKFGKGEVEGVCASEAGNNGVAGATMIPLLALGVPGDVVTAVILGAFTIHNLAPGPLLFQTNADIVYAIFLGVMFSSIVLLIAGRFVMKSFAVITRVPGELLMPIVFLFCLFGSYAVANNLFDVGVMLFFGVIGFAFKKTQIPIAPFILAFILAPKFEDNLRRSLLIADDWTYFFRSPICWVFIVLFVASLVWSARHEIKDAKIDRQGPQS